MIFFSHWMDKYLTIYVSLKPGMQMCKIFVQYLPVFWILRFEGLNALIISTGHCKTLVQYNSITIVIKEQSLVLFK